MTELIKSQLCVIIVMTYCGLAAALIYDFFTLFIKRIVKKSKVSKIIIRIFGYLVIGMLAADFLMYCQNGKVTFSELTFTKPGVYTYKVNEVPGTDTDVDYDGMESTVTITVTEKNAIGDLDAKVTYTSINGQEHN